MAPKINQDSFKVLKSFPSQTKPFNWLFGIFDGHGPYGEIISQYVSKTIPDLINSKLQSISKEYSKRIFSEKDNYGLILERNDKIKSELTQHFEQLDDIVFERYKEISNV